MTKKELQVELVSTSLRGNYYLKSYGQKGPRMCPIVVLGRLVMTVAPKAKWDTPPHCLPVNNYTGKKSYFLMGSYIHDNRFTINDMDISLEENLDR